MIRWMSRLTLNQRLALVAVVLGAVAIAASPYPGSRVTIDARELALIVSRGADRIEPASLAAWIVEGRADYRLIDLRPEAEYAQYHIPGAVNVPLAGLLDAGLGRQEKLVLYSGDGVHAAQAWMLLRAQGFAGAYVLTGGLAAWTDQVVAPVLAEHPTPDERARDDRRRALSAYFGGRPRTASSDGGQAPAMMAAPATPAGAKVVAPPTPAGGAKPPAKKKKEGC
jgi:rhodanese-related sulfurtransferase